MTCGWLAVLMMKAAVRPSPRGLVQTYKGGDADDDGGDAMMMVVMVMVMVIVMVVMIVAVVIGATTGLSTLTPNLGL